MEKRAPDSVWAISASKRQVRKPNPKISNCNLTFLHLPAEIKLLVCGYLFIEDIHTLSTVSTDFKKFIDEHYVRKQICLPNDIVECADAGGRYIMSLKVDFRCVPSVKDHSDKKSKPVSKVKMTHCVEAVKLLNLARLNEVILRMDISRDRRFHFRIELCPLYSEMCMLIMGNASCLQSLDITLLRSETSLAIMEKLANNTSSLKRVTLRNPAKLGTTFFEFFPYSTFQLVRCLFKTSKIESLHLLDFELHEYHEDPYTQFESKTLRELFVSYGSIYSDNEDWLKNYTELSCPELIELRVFFIDSTNICLFHLCIVVPGLADGLSKNSPFFEKYNMRPFMEWILDGDRENYCCNSSCPYYHDNDIDYELW